MSNGDRVEEAARNLRLALPLMSRHGVPATPRNYAVWYEYASGTNAALSNALDALMAANGASTIGEEEMKRLYAQFVTPPGHEQVENGCDGVLRAIETVREIIDQAGGDATRYEASLEGYSSRLAPDTGLDELREVIAGLREETRHAVESTHELTHRLEESRAEAAGLRDELERAREEANTDVLTGLANRKALRSAYDALDKSAEHDVGHGLIIGDIDHFKRVNDEHGHLVGDKIIKHVAAVMEATVRGKDTVARIGGEEFAILLPDTQFAGAMAVAENIRCAIERGRLVKAQTREQIGAVTASFGVTAVLEGEQIEDALGRADAALYRAKRGGRNRVEHGEPAPAATGTHG